MKHEHLKFHIIPIGKNDSNWKCEKWLKRKKKHAGKLYDANVNCHFQSTDSRLYNQVALPYILYTCFEYLNTKNSH